LLSPTTFYACKIEAFTSAFFQVILFPAQKHKVASTLFKNKNYASHFSKFQVIRFKLDDNFYGIFKYIHYYQYIY
jgi:hypothetical protein